MRLAACPLVLLALAAPLPAQEEPPLPRTVHRFAVERISGKPITLAEYAGDVLLLVNVASECGFTPQYAGLQSLYDTHAERGLSILGFPCDDFGGQEPGSNEEIRAFCWERYRVTFPLFAKVRVRGEESHPLFRHLTMRSPFPGEVTWNFEKWIVNRHGDVVARFPPATPPDDPALRRRLEVELAAQAPQRVGWPSADTGPAASAIHAALAIARREDREVCVHFTAPSADDARLRAFLAAPNVRATLDRDVVRVVVDVEHQPDGEPIRAMLADGRATGVPFLAWLAADGMLVARSLDAQGRNVAEPRTPEAIEALLAILETRVRRASPRDVAGLRQTLRGDDEPPPERRRGAGR